LIDVIDQSKSAIVITDVDQISARIWYITRTDKDMTIKISNKEIFECYIDGYLGDIKTRMISMDKHMRHDWYMLSPTEFCEKYNPDWDNIIQCGVSSYNDILDTFDDIIDILAKQRADVVNSENNQYITVIYSEPLEG
jgi:hypothetical protein